MMAQKSKSVDGLTKGIEGLFKKNKVTYARGWDRSPGPRARFCDERRRHDGIAGREERRSRDGFGARDLPGVEVDEETIVTSTGALREAKEVPKRMVVVGGGVRWLNGFK